MDHFKKVTKSSHHTSSSGTARKVTVAGLQKTIEEMEKREDTLALDLKQSREWYTELCGGMRELKIVYELLMKENGLLRKENYEYAQGMQEMNATMIQLKRQPGPYKQGDDNPHVKLGAIVSKLMGMGGVDLGTPQWHGGQSEKETHSGQNPRVEELFDSECEARTDDGYHSGPRARNDEDSDSDRGARPGQRSPSGRGARTDGIETRVRKDDRNNGRRARNDGESVNEREARIDQEYHSGQGGARTKTRRRKDDRDRKPGHQK